MPVQTMHNSIAIAGIHTGIGKTIASAIIAEATGSDYWKPVQAGVEETDTRTIRSLLTNGSKRVHNESVVLTQPLSPHAAAVIDGVVIDYAKFQWPQTPNRLLVETAGGLLSPISSSGTMADFISLYHLPVILVIQHYLGSINHSLMTLEVLRNRSINVLGIVYNGAENKSSETFIEQYCSVPVLARIPHLEVISNQTIVKCADQVRVGLLRYV